MVMDSLGLARTLLSKIGAICPWKCRIAHNLENAQLKSTSTKWDLTTLTKDHYNLKPNIYLKKQFWPKWFHHYSKLFGQYIETGRFNYSVNVLTLTLFRSLPVGRSYAKDILMEKDPTACTWRDLIIWSMS